MPCSRAEVEGKAVFQKQKVFAYFVFFFEVRHPRCVANNKNKLSGVYAHRQTRLCFLVVRLLY